MTAAATEVAAPERSYQQRMEALANANRIRSARKVLKLDLKHGRESIVDQVREPPAEIETMKVFQLLLAAPKVGRVKADKMLRFAGVSPSKTVGGLSPRQRRELAVLLGRHGL